MSVRDLWSNKALYRATPFILLHKLHKPALPPYRHRYCTYRLYKWTQPLNPPLLPSLVRRRRRRIFITLGANATTCRRQAIKITLGANATTCRRQAIIITLGANATTCKRQAIYILVSIHPPIPRQRRQTNTPKRISLKRDHLKTIPQPTHPPIP
jgi:hypothetical protein